MSVILLILSLGGFFLAYEVGKAELEDSDPFFDVIKSSVNNSVFVAACMMATGGLLGIGSAFSQSSYWE
ncbi:hypothetical protein P9112_000511 [Eukaryota sp. TZLM1-RC]